MILSLGEQASLFLVTVVTGAVIGFFYDILRVVRRILPHKRWIIQIEDGLYWICVIFFMFFIMMQKNDGEIRLFSVIGAFLGMLLYYLLLSHLFLAVSDRVLAVIFYVVRLFLTIILTPFRLCYLLVRSPVKKAHSFLFGNSQKLLHFSKRYVRIRKKKLVRNVNILFRKK